MDCAEISLSRINAGAEIEITINGVLRAAKIEMRNKKNESEIKKPDKLFVQPS